MGVGIAVLPRQEESRGTVSEDTTIVDEVEIEDFMPFIQPPQWVLFSGINPAAFKLYCIMFAHVNLSDGKCEIWPSQRTLADLMGLKKEDSIPGLLNQLYAIGAITVKRIREGMIKRNRYTIKRRPPQGWNKPTSLAQATKTNNDKTAGQPVPPNQGVRTPKSGGSVPPNQGVKQEPLPQQEPLKERDTSYVGISSSEIASRPSDMPTGKELEISSKRDDVEQACELLAELIEANGSKKPTITDKWRDAARLLMDRDGKSLAQVLAAIRWCQDDEFWRGNILSMPKLRQQYDRLRLAAMRKGSDSHASGRKDDLGTDAHLQRYLERAAAREADERAGGLPANLWDRAYAVGELLGAQS